MPRLVLTSFLLSLFLQVQASTLTSSGSGNWTNATTWAGIGVPAAGNTMVISNGHTVTVDGNLSYTGASMVVHVHGTWRFNGGGAKITLPAGSAVIIHDGGSVTSVAPGNGGTSQRIIIGSTTYWQGGPGSSVSGPWSWPQDVLPVELIAFNGSAQGDAVMLRWSTASESQSAQFHILRSRDGQAWTSVASQDAAGHSQQRIDYAYTDAGLAAGTWYYALTQSDLDGTLNELGVVAVEVRRTTSALRCALNEADPRRLNVWLTDAEDQALPFTLVDLARGTMLGLGAANLGAGGGLLELPPLAPGNYMVRVDDGQEAMGCRFVLTR